MRALGTRAFPLQTHHPSNCLHLYCLIRWTNCYFPVPLAFIFWLPFIPLTCPTVAQAGLRPHYLAVLLLHNVMLLHA